MFFENRKRSNIGENLLKNNLFKQMAKKKAAKKKKKR